MMILLAQGGYFWSRSMSSWNVGEWVIFILLMCGIIAIGIVVLKKLEMWPPPTWLLQILGIVLAIAVGIIAIRFLMSL